MVQARTTDCGNSLRRHWLHGEQTNSKTGTAQRYPNGILNHSQLYANGKPGWCLKHQPGIPRRHCYPCQGQQKSALCFHHLFPVILLLPAHLHLLCRQKDFHRSHFPVPQVEQLLILQNNSFHNESGPARQPS